MIFQSFETLEGSEILTSINLCFLLISIRYYIKIYIFCFLNRIFHNIVKLIFYAYLCNLKLIHKLM